MDTLFPTIFLLIRSVCSSNILYVSSVPFRSYHMWNQVLAFELVERGHNITFLKTYQGGLMTRENYTEILIEGVQELVQNTKSLFEKDSSSPVRFITDVQNAYISISQKSAKSTGLSYLLDSYKDFKFDLIIFDVTGGTCFYPLIKKFEYPPAIAVTQYPQLTITAFDLGHQLNPSYIPWDRFAYDNEMTFFERVWNFIFTYLQAGLRYTYQYKKQDEIARNIFGEDTPSMEVLQRNISLMFFNIDPILNYAQPLAPNIIPVGGLHLTQSKKLPQDLQKILDGAKNGAIVFSLGSILQSSKLSQKIQKSLLDAFSQIPETVLWKFESKIENSPKNVIVRKWLPQNDVLGHPNVKLFIGHGGALSTQEALYYGMPILCIPFYRDQDHTANIIVKRKFGLSLSLREIESNLVLQKLEEVLRNPMYSKNMKKASSMFRNRKETSLERAVFWVEYLLQYGNVDFLSTAARDLPFYKSLCLDVLLFLMSVAVILIVLFYKLVQFILVIKSRKGNVKLS